MDQVCFLSADDLREFYYTFLATFVRALRNAVGVEFKGSDFVGFKSCDAPLHNVSVLGSLKTLAMGDGFSVEVAQSSYLWVLGRLAQACLDSTLTKYQHPIPRGPVWKY